MHGDNMIPDQRVQEAVTWAVGGKDKEWLYRHMVSQKKKKKRNKGNKYVVI